MHFLAPDRCCWACSRRRCRGSSTASAGGARGRSASRRWSCCCAPSARSRRGGACATSRCWSLRTALAAALPLAFARPFAEVRSDLPAVDGALAERGHRARRLGEHAPAPAPAARRCSSVARARARDVVEHLSPDSDVALVLASEGIAGARRRAVERSRRACSAALARPSPPRRARADFAAALRRATQILDRRRRRGDRLIYVISDLQATGWEDVAARAARRRPRRSSSST